MNHNVEHVLRLAKEMGAEVLDVRKGRAKHTKLTIRTKEGAVFKHGVNLSPHKRMEQAAYLRQAINRANRKDR